MLFIKTRKALEMTQVVTRARWHVNGLFVQETCHEHLLLAVRSRNVVTLVQSERQIGSEWKEVSAAEVSVVLFRVEVRRVQPAAVVQETHKSEGGQKVVAKQEAEDSGSVSEVNNNKI